ncbi:hypothetical protein VTO73DRAFT_1974 [Trametes versicolor]
MGLSVSDSAMLWVMCAPTGPYMSNGVRPLSLLALRDNIRAWPGGTGEYKIAGNYGPVLGPHQDAQEKGYDQTLWLLGEKITEAGVMNIFVVLRRDDGGVDLFTPPLDGTILAGVTRESVLDLAGAHSSRTTLPDLPHTMRLHPAEREFTISELQQWLVEGRLLEIFAVGTAVIVVPITRIGYEGEEMILPSFEGGLGPVGRALHTRITDIQDGRVEWDGWSVVCD